MATSSWADGAVDETIGSGQDRADLATFEAAHDGESPTNGTNCQGSITGDVTSGTVYWSGWQAGQNATTRIILTSKAGDEPDGINDASGSKALISNQMNPYDVAVEMHMDITEVEFTGNLLYSPGADSVYNITKCVFRDNAALDAVKTYGTNTHTINIGGCLFKDISNAHKSAITSQGSGATVYIVNTTIVGSDGLGAEGIYRTAGTVNIKNVALANNTADLSGTIGTTTSGSEDGHADFTITHNDADDFTEPSTGDYTVEDGGGSDLDGSGTAEAASWFTTYCPTDLLGTAWASPPSVGCYEVVAAGGGWTGKIGGVTNPGKVGGV